MFKTRKIHSFTKLSALVLAVFIVHGCANFGGNELSLLSGSKVLDDLEVPPGLSPLPDAEQFPLPEDLNANLKNTSNLSQEQLRNFEIWMQFEEYKKYRDETEGVNMTRDEYQLAKARGEGIFKVVTEITPEETARLKVHDSIDSVWERMPGLLKDMNVLVNSINDEKRLIIVSNVPSDQLPRLSQRLGFTPYSGKVDELHFQSEIGGKTVISAKTDLNIEVNAEAGQPFMERLRFFLLASYETDGYVLEDIAPAVLKNRILRDDNGTLIIVSDNDFDTTWVSVGRSLEGSGVNIDDLDRSEGIYIVSYDTVAKKKKKSRWRFWRRNKQELPESKQLTVLVSETENGSEIRVVAGEDVADDNNEAAENLLTIIHDRLLA